MTFGVAGTANAEMVQGFDMGCQLIGIEETPGRFVYGRLVLWRIAP